MKVTVNELVSAEPALSRLMRAETLPGKQMFGLLGVISKIKAPLADWQATRQEVVSRYAAEGESVPAERMAEYEAELTPVLETEIDVNGAACEVSAKCVVSVADMILLYGGNLVKLIDLPKHAQESLKAWDDDPAEEPNSGEDNDGESEGDPA